MRHVSIAEFKDRASQIIAAVEAGDEIIITRHGKAAVKLVPVQESAATRRARVKAALDKMAEHRERMRAEGRTATIEEMIAWKNDGRK